MKSSEVAVWRGSKSSPGEEAVQLGKWTVEPGVLEELVVADIVLGDAVCAECRRLELSGLWVYILLELEA